MTALRRAYLDVVLARAAWRAAKDVEGQVAHWLLEGHADSADLAQARMRTQETRAEHQRAQRLYNQAMQQTGLGEGRRHA